MKNDRSVSVATAAGSAGAKKLGQPVPDSNFASEREKLGAAAGAAVDARTVLVPEGAAERALGALLAEDAVLLGGELGAPLGVGLGGWGGGGLGVGVAHVRIVRPLCVESMTSPGPARIDWPGARRPTRPPRPADGDPRTRRLAALLRVDPRGRAQPGLDPDTGASRRDRGDPPGHRGDLARCAREAGRRGHDDRPSVVAASRCWSCSWSSAATCSARRSSDDRRTREVFRPRRVHAADRPSTTTPSGSDPWARSTTRPTTPPGPRASTTSSRRPATRDRRGRAR